MTGASDGSSRRRRSRSVTSSGSVVGIDLDITMGEVAGPDPGAALAHADIDGDADILALHMGGNGRFVVIRTALALFGDRDAADPDSQLVAVGLFAGLADRHHDAAPIGIFA